MSTDLITRLRAALDDHEGAALGAKGHTSGVWEQDDGPAGDITLYDGTGKLTMGQARHIGRHDPARVLADIAAKRKILDEYAEVAQYDGAGDYEYAYGHADGLGIAVRAIAEAYGITEDDA